MVSDTEVCPTCEWIFQDVDPETADVDAAPKKRSGLRMSDLTKRDTSLCSLCSSVTQEMPASLRGRNDIFLAAQWTWKKDYWAEVLEMSYIYTNQSNVETQVRRWLHPEPYSQPGAALPRPASTDSEACTSLAAYWLSNCVNNHEECRPKNGDSVWLPSRLIDIQSNPHLILTSELEVTSPSPSYISLSHLWAAGVILKLTQANLEDFLQEIPMKDLSPTFIEAFVVTRKLGVRYLWIDSLCIMQDSASDWRAESSVMGKVYGHSLCNIAASGSSQTYGPGYGGLFQERDATKITSETTYIKARGIITTYSFANNSIWCAEISNAPLNNRGWVLQERLLSPRTLHYASQLFWECQAIEACETFPSGIPERDCDATQDCVRMTWHPLTLKTWRKPQEIFSEPLWDHVLQSYTRCKLTKASDRLVAIAGLAMEVQSHWDDQYLAGLWKRDFPRCLLWSLWNLEGYLERPEFYRCPSWSWASLDFEVADVEFPWPDHVKQNLVRLIDVQLHGEERNNFSHFTEGFIKLEGRIGPMSPILSSIAYSHGEWRDSDYPFQMRFDLEDSWPEGDLHCMPIAIVDQNGEEPVIECIILRSVDEEKLHFARVGLGSAPLDPDKDLDIPCELQWIMDFAYPNPVRAESLTVVTIV